MSRRAGVGEGEEGKCQCRGSTITLGAGEEGGRVRYVRYMCAGRREPRIIRTFVHRTALASCDVTRQAMSSDSNAYVVLIVQTHEGQLEDKDDDFYG